MEKVRVVAELTGNHLGNIDRLLTMVEGSLEAGVDYVKVQKRNVDTFYSAEELSRPYSSPFGSTYGDYRRGLELDEEAFLALDEEFPGLWFSSALDLESFNFLTLFDIPWIKLPSTISRHRDYIWYAIRHCLRGVVISLGMTDNDFYAEVTDLLLEDFDVADNSYLLQCTSSYPAPRHELNLRLINDIEWLHYPVRPGYSSHDEGSFGSVLAVAAGARMIEKHVTLPGAEWVERNNVALDLSDGSFARYVKDIRQAELAVGDGVPRVTSSEDHKY